MPSERKVVAYRPDSIEEKILSKMTKASGLSMARVIGTALREKANREGIIITDDAPSIQSGAADDYADLAEAEKEELAADYKAARANYAGGTSFTHEQVFAPLRAELAST